MIRTRVGFAASTEAIEVVFEPRKGSYEDLLKVYWQHSMQGVVVFNANQEKLAEESKLQHPGRSMYISKDTSFTPAGREHQKYILQRNKDVFNALKLSTEEEIMTSSPAARLNGFVAGFGCVAQLDKEWKTFGISDEAVYRRVRQLCGRRRR